jgi:hypothetical protein
VCAHKSPTNALSGVQKLMVIRYLRNRYPFCEWCESAERTWCLGRAQLVRTLHLQAAIFSGILQIYDSNQFIS